MQKRQQEREHRRELEFVGDQDHGQHGEQQQGPSIARRSDIRCSVRFRLKEFRKPPLLTASGRSAHFDSAHSCDCPASMRSTSITEPLAVTTQNF